MTDLMLLRRHFRDSRINTLIYVRARGDYRAITKEGIKIIQEYYRYKHGNILSIKIPNGSFWDGHFNKRIPKINDITEESYKELKNMHGEEFIKQLVDMLESPQINQLDERIKNQKYMTINQVKQYLPYSNRVIIKYIKSGVVKGTKIGNIWQLDKESVIKACTGGKFDPPAPQ